MRRLSLVWLLLVGVSCTVRVPRSPPRLGFAVKAKVHAQAQVTVPAPPPPPAPAVAIEGAPVVEFFGIPLEGAQDVVFVLDCSGSMDNAAQGSIAQVSTAPGPPEAPPAPDAPPPSEPPPATEPPAAAPAVPRKIEVAQAELIAALQRLPEGTRMNVIFFNTDIDAFAPDFVVIAEASREGLVGFVKEAVPTGRTALVPAMRTAFLMNPRRIVLLSDGLGNVGGGSSTLLRDAREAMRGGVRIDTIGVGEGQDEALLGTLARESGGLYQAL